MLLILMVHTRNGLAVHLVLPRSLRHKINAGHQAIGGLIGIILVLKSSLIAEQQQKMSYRMESTPLPLMVLSMWKPQDFLTATILTHSSIELNYLAGLKVVQSHLKFGMTMSKLNNIP